MLEASVMSKLSSFAVCPARELEVQWFYKKTAGIAQGDRWAPYEELENTVIERAFQAGVDRVEFGAGHFPVVLSERRQYNTLDDTSRERMLLRGTWFFQRSDGTLQPYSEDIAHTLELSFSSHHRSCSGCFDTLWRAITFAKLCSRVHKCAWGCWHVVGNNEMQLM